MESTKAEPVTQTAKRHIVHIINPVSGSGKKFKRTKTVLSELKEDVYLTKRNGDCRDFISELLTKDPYAHIVAHGGDGTMNEAVEGILAANAGHTALFTGVPSGSGNDFLRYSYEEKCELGKEYPTDVIRSGDKYSVNVLNVGFDCTVVSEAEKIRKFPGIGNSFSYILGVVSALTKKDVFTTTVELGGIPKKDGTSTNESISGSFLLAALANGRYYGGGFKVAPLADSSDGLIDVLLINNVSLPKFASLVSGFMKGSHIDENGKVLKKFSEILTYRRCRTISFDGIKQSCYDGEIINETSVSAELIPAAIIYTPPKKEWIV